MRINEDFQILAKKLDNCELLTNYNLNVLNEDMMSLQNAFIGALVTRDISEIREIEITLRDLKCDNANEATVNFRLRLNGSREIDYNVVLNLAQSTPQTMVIPIHITDTDPLANQTLNKVELKKVDLADNVFCRDLNVKIVYE